MMDKKKEKKKKDPLSCPKVSVGESFLTHICFAATIHSEDHTALKFKQHTSKMSSGVSCTLNTPYQGIPFM